MTGRLTAPERRRSLRIAAAFALAIVTLLLLAGCVDQTKDINPTSSPTTIPTSTPVTTTVTILKTVTIIEAVTICPTPGNGSYWIMINPINDVKKGNTPFIINGTTNLPSDPSQGGKLKIVTYPTKLDPRRPEGEHSVEDYGSIFTAVVDIQKGDSCINTFSSGSPGLDAKPGEYFVTVSKFGSSRGDPGFVENQTQFDIIL